jgi:hypothetical protein
MERMSPTVPMTRSELLRSGLFLGSALLVAAVFIFTQQIIGRLTHEVETTSRVLARFCAQASFPATRDPELQTIFAEVIGSIDFPIVITDNEGMPRAWRDIGVDPASVNSTSIDSLKEGLSIAPVIRQRIERVRLQVLRLDRKNTPIVMTQSGTKVKLGAVHYGEPQVLERLRWMPFLSVGGVVLLLAIGLLGLSGIQQAEKRTIWVGMARETAHQLGTPLSSMMGWIELLRGGARRAPARRSRAARGPGGDAVRDGARHRAPEQGGAALQPRRLGAGAPAPGRHPGGARGGRVPAPPAAAERLAGRDPRALRGGAADQPQPRAARVGAREPVLERAQRARHASRA